MRFFLQTIAILALTFGGASVSAQGLTTEADAVVLHGSSANTSSPATVKMKKLEKKTPEYKTMKSEG